MTDNRRVVDEALGRDWITWIGDADLLRIGHVVASTDYAVIHYCDPWHEKFFANRDSLLQAVRRGLSRPGPDRMDRVRRWCTTVDSHAELDGHIKAVVAGREALHSALCALDHDALADLLRAVAYHINGPQDRAEVGDAWLEDLGFVFHWPDEDTDGDLVVDVPADLCEQIATAHPSLVIEIAKALLLMGEEMPASPFRVFCELAPSAIQPL
ncbi:MAG: hypothetical protein ACYCZN_01215 [Candidatus Dormibacteria bacterium]